MDGMFSREDALRHLEIERQQTLLMESINAILASINPYEQGQDEVPELKEANDAMKELIKEKTTLCRNNKVDFRILPPGVRQIFPPLNP